MLLSFVDFADNETLFEKVITNLSGWGKSFQRQKKFLVINYPNSKCNGHFYNIDDMNLILSSDVIVLPENITEPDDIEKWLMSQTV